MTSTIPTPVAAALGVVPTVLDGVRHLPAKAIQLPILALSTGLTTVEHVRKTYEALAERGEHVVDRLRGGAEDLVEDISDRADDLEDRLEDLLAGSPVAQAYDKVEDALEDVSATVKERVDGKSPVEVVKEVASEATDKAGSLADDLKDELAGAKDAVQDAARDVAEDVTQDAVPEAEQPKGHATPKAPQGEVERVDSAASPRAVAIVEQVSALSDAPKEVEHDDLPLADYDHMTLGSLRGRLRSLTLDELVVVRAYEKSHADRLPVVTMLDNRMARLAVDEAEPSQGSSKAEPPVKPKAAKKPKVTPATAAEPDGAPTGSAPTRPLN